MLKGERCDGRKQEKKVNGLVENILQSVALYTNLCLGSVNTIKHRFKA